MLLGDVGMGKSTTVVDEAELLRSSVKGDAHAVVHQDLKLLTEEQIYRRVFLHPEVVSWFKGQCALTLFLDSLDECWRRLEELESILVGELEALLRQTKQPLYLRLTCRSAEWRGDTGSALKRLFGHDRTKDSVQVYVLAPLSKSNVETAANAHGLNGNHFVEAVQNKNVQALASHPIF